MSSELKIGAWTHVLGPTWRRYAWLDTWTSPSFEERYLQPGPWSLSLPYNDQTSPINSTSLLTCDFRAGRYTGKINHAEAGRGDDGREILSLAGVDAMTYLARSNAWPVPTTPAVAGDVSQAAAYYDDSGPGETVLHKLIKLNALDRDGQPFTLAPDQGRGGTVTLHERNTNLLEVLAKECRTANLGVRVGLVSDDPNSSTAELTCWFFEPRDQSAEFRISTDAGTLVTWQQADDAPTATRALVAGGGQGSARILRLVIDEAAEAASGQQVEIFVDERGTTDPTALDKYGLQAIADAAAQSSATIEATDAEGMRYDGGDLIQVSDLLTLSLGTKTADDGTVIDADGTVERLEAVVITQDDDSAVKVSLVPGNADGSSPTYKRAAVQRQLRRDVDALQRGF